MKVIDLSAYRARKALESLEKRVGEHALESRIGAVRAMKICFKAWLKDRDVANAR